MALVIGLLIPLSLVAIFGLRRDPATHPRFYVAPVLLAVLAVAAVLATDAGPTPDFWRGFCAGLAAIAAAAFTLVLQSFAPLSWWIREARPQVPDA